MAVRLSTFVNWRTFDENDSFLTHEICHNCGCQSTIYMSVEHLNEHGEKIDYSLICGGCISKIRKRMDDTYIKYIKEAKRDNEINKTFSG